MHRVNVARIIRWSGMAAMVLAIGLLAIPAQAGEMTLKGRNVQSKATSSWAQIGDDESHGIGAYEADGLGFHENGEVSTYVSKGLYDWRHGTDQHSGYVVRTYADGSTTTSHFEGTTSSDAGAATWNGTVVYVSGTGRFDGIKGEGTYEGQRYLNKMSVTDWEMRVVLPD